VVTAVRVVPAVGFPQYEAFPLLEGSTRFESFPPFE
jgi:hypothetical protein